MRIALTGATGFAGKLILSELKIAKHEIKTLARQPERLDQTQAEIIKGDLSDAAALALLVANAEVVVHVAGAISAHNRAGYFATNLNGTKKLYEAARQAKAERFVFVSSISAREPKLSHYAASKAAAEHFLLGQTSGPKVLILRPSAIYGPGDKATLPLLKALQSHFAILPGRASARFSLIHVEDFARVVADAAFSDASGIFEVDDLGGGHTWADLAKINRDITGQPQKQIHAPKPLAHTVAAFAELFGAVWGKPSMTNRGKVAELYHSDWVVRGANWPRDNPIGLAEGYADTLRWYIQEGWLPAKSQIVRKRV